MNQQTWTVAVVAWACVEREPPPCDTVGCLAEQVEPALACPSEACAAPYRDTLEALQPPEQLGVALELSRRHPNGRAARLCAWLTEPADRATCDTWHRRPHLWTPLFPSRPLQPPARAVAAAGGAPFGPCADHAAPAACLLQHAAGLGRAGDALGARAACTAGVPVGAAEAAGLPHDKLVEECLFVSADGLTRRTMADSAAAELTVERFNSALLLCRDAGQFASQCFTHQAQQAARGLSSRGLAEDVEWARLAALADGGRRALSAAHAGPVAGHVASLTWTLGLQRVPDTVSASAFIERASAHAPAPELRSALVRRAALPRHVGPEEVEALRLPDARGPVSPCVALDETHWRPSLPDAEVDAALSILADAARRDRRSGLLAKAQASDHEAVAAAARAWAAWPADRPLGCHRGEVETLPR